MADAALRDVIATDLPEFFAHQRDPEATRMAAFTSRDWQAFTAHWAKILADATIIKKAILYDGRIAGNIVCFGPPGDRQVGYWIGRDYWGRGLASSALSQFLREVRARPLYAYVAKHNVASIRVLEKCGFTLSRTETAASGAGNAAVEELVMKLDACDDGRESQRPEPGSSRR